MIIGRISGDYRANVGGISGEWLFSNTGFPLFKSTKWKTFWILMNSPRKMLKFVFSPHFSSKNNIKRFYLCVHDSYPPTRSFISMLKKEHVHTHISITHHQAGLPQRRKYADTNNRINTIVRNYDNAQPIDYLRAISYNILEIFDLI